MRFWLLTVWPLLVLESHQSQIHTLIMCTNVEELTEARERSKNSTTNESYEGTINYYNNVGAKHFDQDMKAHQQAGYNGNKVAIEIIKQYCPNKDSAVLDLGAGTGELGCLLHLEGYTNISAYDGSSEMLKIARSKNVYSNFYHETLLPGKLSTAVKDGSFDLVACLNCFYRKHMDEHHIEAILQMIKPQGIILIICNKGYQLDSVVEKFEIIKSEKRWKQNEMKIIGSTDEPHVAYVFQII